VQVYQLVEIIETNKRKKRASELLRGMWKYEFFKILFETT